MHIIHWRFWDSVINCLTAFNLIFSKFFSRNIPSHTSRDTTVLITQFGNADLTLSRGRQSSFLISSSVFGNGFWYFPNVSLVSDMLLKSLLLRSSGSMQSSSLVQDRLARCSEWAGPGYQPLCQPLAGLTEGQETSDARAYTGTFLHHFFLSQTK